MEPGARAAQAVSDRASLARFRLRLAAACALLLGLAMTQSAGLLVADTKLDLAVDPGGFLGRALHLWDPLGAFGQVQNQAYGYLWPMGPFFWLGSLVDLPGWVVQRLWVALVLCVAMAGAALLVRAFGARHDLACLLGGFAYAFSPRIVSTLGPISSEAWAAALAPWVLLPLVLGARQGSARRYAALAGLAVAMVGGINAAASAAVLPLGLLWILTRSPGPRRRTLLLWWPLFTALGTLWWLVPLGVLGSNSPPFLDFIESAATTTFSTTLVDSLRGTSDWVPYLDTTWRAGNDLIRDFWYPVTSGVLLFFGLAGILRRDTGHRLFLSTGLLLGLVLIGFGHTGAVEGWGAPQQQALMDGVLAPLRNIHKFDPVVRIPLVIGLALLVDGWMSRIRSPRTGRPAAADPLNRVTSGVLVATSIAAVLSGALPAAAGRLAPADGFLDIPGYWPDAAAWLAERQGTGGAANHGTALLVPGSAFGRYVWGFPRDEPMQWLAAEPWAVRNAVPLAPPGNIRMLDAVEERLAQGRGSPGLAAYLRRAGVSHVVVRNDLQRTAYLPDPVLVHQALEDSPGISRVAAFGPEVGGEAVLDRPDGRVVVNGGWQTRSPALEIYHVWGQTGVAVSTTDVPVVVGGPEDLLDLADLGVLAQEPTQLAVDVEQTPAPARRLILTDGLRAAERQFGRVHDGTSATRTPGDMRRLANPTRDYLLGEDDRWSTKATLEGASALSASSSMSDADAAGTVQRGQHPFAAVDGHPETAWVASPDASEPPWWEVDFGGPRSVRAVWLRAGADDGAQVVRLRTQHVLTDPVELPAGGTRRVLVDEQNTGWLRVEDASGRAGQRLALAEVEVPDLRVRRPLVLPETPSAWGNPAAVVLRAQRDDRTGCAEVDRAVRCVETREVAPEEPFDLGRRFSIVQGEEFEADLRAQLRPGEDADRLLTAGLPIGVTGSSRGARDPRAGPLAAVDGDPFTTWIAAETDLRPTLEVTWLEKRRITGLRMVVERAAPARLPTRLRLSWPGGRRGVRLDDQGRVRFPPIRTDRLVLEVEGAELAGGLGFQREPSQLPVGVGELRIRGLPLLPVVLPDTARTYRCGSGPVVWVNGRPTQTTVTASPQHLAAGRPVRASPCSSDRVALRSGANRVRVEASDTFVPRSLVFTSGAAGAAGVAGADSGPAVAAVGYRPVEPTEGVLDPTGSAGSAGSAGSLTAGDAVVLRRNVNDGWRATQQDQALESFVADGWQQGWRLRDAQAPVSLAFTPDLPYRLGLAGGGVAFALLLLLLQLPARRWPGREDPVVGEVLGSPPVLLVLALTGAGVLAGWAGLAVAAVAVGGVLALNRQPAAAQEAGRWLTAGLVLPAAAAYAVLPWGDQDGWAGSLAWPHYLVVIAVSAVLGWLVLDLPAGPRDQGGRRFFHRIAGSSTKR